MGVTPVNVNTPQGSAAVDANVTGDVSDVEDVDGIVPAAAPGQTGTVANGDTFGGVVKGAAAGQVGVGQAPTGNSAIDVTLDAFADANSGNPAALAALGATAAAIKQNPQEYINPDGSINKEAFANLLTSQFAGAGSVVLPSTAMVQREQTLFFGPSESGANVGVSGSGGTAPTPPSGGPVTVGGGTPISVSVNTQGTYNNLGSLADGDVMTCAFIVMMNATQSAQDDLKTIMDGVQLINKQKEALRNIQDEINKQCAALATCNANAPADRLGGSFSNANTTGIAVTDATSVDSAGINTSGDLDQPGKYSFAWVSDGNGGGTQVESYTTVGPDGNPLPGGFTISGTGVWDSGPPPKMYLQKADLDNAQTTIKNDLDSLSELSETESLRLQMAMDRVSKFMQTLSNLEKKMSDTDSAIMQNQK